MNDYDDRIESAAEYICVSLYPAELRSEYVRHIRSSHKADLLVYALQILATGMTSIFVGLLTNYLYDKRKKKHEVRKRKQLKGLIAQQKRNIKALEDLLKLERAQAKRRASISLSLHKELVLKIEGNDPSINILLKSALATLEKEGQAALRIHVDSHTGRGNG